MVPNILAKEWSHSGDSEIFWEFWNSTHFHQVFWIFLGIKVRGMFWDIGFLSCTSLRLRLFLGPELFNFFLWTERYDEGLGRLVELYASMRFRNGGQFLFFAFFGNPSFGRGFEIALQTISWVRTFSGSVWNAFWAFSVFLAFLKI